MFRLITSPALFWNYTNRHAASAGIAVVASFLVAYSLALQSLLWAVIAAFLMSVTTRGTPLRQGMMMFSFMVAAVFTGLLLHFYVPTHLMLGILAAVLAGSAFGYYYFAPGRKLRLMMWIIFPALIFIASLQPVSTSALADQRLLACIIGSIIGLFVGMIVAFVNIEKEFKQGLSPVLAALARYAHSMGIYLQPSVLTQVRSDKIAIENSLVRYKNAYPEWVFEVGFNPGVRSFYRYFLVKLDQVLEAVFALAYLFSLKINVDLIAKLKPELNHCLQTNADLFAVLSNYFEFHPVPADAANFTNDISHLEKALEKLLPGSPELLDLNQDYLYLSAIVRNIKELRYLLIQLIAALPTS